MHYLLVSIIVINKKNLLLNFVYSKLQSFWNQIIFPYNKQVKQEKQKVFKLILDVLILYFPSCYVGAVDDNNCLVSRLKTEMVSLGEKIDDLKKYSISGFHICIN